MHLTDRPARIAVFGGTFDPPHKGHLQAAGDVFAALDIDRVVWMPVGTPPHKSKGGVTSARLRLMMVRAAIDGDPRFALCELEVEREGPSYTIDTLRTLRGNGFDVALVMGADQYRSFDSWKDPVGIRELASIVVMDREGDRITDPRVRSVPVTRLDVSSTELRRRVAAGEDPRSLPIPGSVADIVREHALYRS